MFHTPSAFRAGGSLRAFHRATVVAMVMVVVVVVVIMILSEL